MKKMNVKNVRKVPKKGVIHKAEIVPKVDKKLERAANLLKKVDAFRKKVKDAYVDSDRMVDAVIDAMLSRKHLIIAGSHGIAKSLITRDCFKLVAGAEQFDTIMTKEQLIDEILGPVDIAALKNGEMTRRIKGYLPAANFAFLDELFRASTALFPSLFRILNERTFNQGNQVVECPLHCAVAAVNFTVEDDELAAFLDRFQLQIKVFPIKDTKAISELVFRHNAGSIGIQVKKEEQLSYDDYLYLTDFISKYELDSVFLDGFVHAIQAYNSRFAEQALSPRRIVHALDFVKTLCVSDRLVNDKKHDDLNVLDSAAIAVVPESSQESSGRVFVAGSGTMKEPSIQAWTDISATAVDKYGRRMLGSADTYSTSELTDTVKPFLNTNRRALDIPVTSDNDVALTNVLKELQEMLVIVKEVYDDLEPEETEKFLRGTEGMATTPGKPAMTCAEFYKHVLNSVNEIRSRKDQLR